MRKKRFGFCMGESKIQHMDNREIAKVFEEMGDLLDIKGESFFKINAYRKAALTIMNLGVDLRTLANDPEALGRIPGIGEGLRKKILELITTGKCTEHEELKSQFPAGIIEMMQLRGLGPKKIQMLYLNLGITSVQELKEAAEKQLIRDLPGMGEKTEKTILTAIEEFGRFEVKRFLIHEAKQEATQLIEYLKKSSEIKQIQYAGSLRRCQETIGDIDILATVKDPEKSHVKVMKYFGEYPGVLNIIAVGDTKSSVILHSGMQADLRVVADSAFGAALHYFTGSKEHNVKIRDLAKKKGLKVSEYGVFKGEKIVGGKTEEEVFAAVGLPYIIPEIRRNEGEIEYGFEHGKFPKFVEIEDIRGDLHNHSKYSDGKNTIEQMAEVFMAKGYEYFAITDHSSLMPITNGMKKADIRRQWKEVDALNKRLKIRILKGCEVDILKDGGLDFEDEILQELDIVVASAHLFQKMPGEDQTKRIIAAVENPYVKILGHPTGRIINRRAEMDFDMKKVIDACVVNKVALEINSDPLRLDLAEKYVRIAKDMGAKFVINTDSHNLTNPDFMEYGIGMARRGWLTAKDVINTWPLQQFDTYF